MHAVATREAMNRIYAVLWSRAKRLWIVVSELAHRRAGAHGSLRLPHPQTRCGLALTIRFILLCSLSLPATRALAQTTLGSSTDHRDLDSDTQYVVEAGSTLTETDANVL